MLTTKTTTVIKQTLLAPVDAFYHLLFLMVQWYDKYVYSPIQVISTPMVEIIPRNITIPISPNKATQITIFTANIVTYSRTLLIVPIALALKNGYYGSAFWMVLFHDYLDHLDGIVAKTQKRMGYIGDDPKLGSFLDAFCDKIVICTSLWSVLLLTDYSRMTSYYHVLFYLSICCTIIVYEAILGIVRVQDYYASSSNESRNLAACMEGKLKEKLETIGLACLCLAMPNPTGSIAGIIGLTSFFTATHLAHKSLYHKLKARYQKEQETQAQNTTPPQPSPPQTSEKNVTTNGDNSPSAPSTPSESANASPPESSSATPSSPQIDYLPEDSPPYECAFSIGCFDLFHHGHVNLLKKMKQVGKKLVVGVHSDESIFQLKKKWPIDPLEKRMANVKQYADVVYAIPAADPTPYILNVIPPSIKNSVYIRGDDMLNFPSRHAVEKLLEVKFVQYTPGVSSTMLRAKLLEQQKQQEGQENGISPESQQSQAQPQELPQQA